MILPPVILSEAEAIAEFDQWVTPTLGTVRESKRFQEELDRLRGLLLDIAAHVDQRGSEELDLPHLLVRLSTDTLEMGSNELREQLAALFSLLYLATAKSDNAVKCQYPLHYRRTRGSDFPVVRRGSIRIAAVPNVLKSTDIIKHCVSLAEHDFRRADDLLQHYVSFLLAGDTDRDQLVAIVDSFRVAERARTGSGSDLLAPLVAFQVRGSVAATGGHDPEAEVRRALISWGMEPSVHFNLTDATAGALAGWLSKHGDTDEGRRTSTTPSNDKTRAFDFIIPFYLPHANNRVFVQSQFYAGDSGSVSHKNVDQAASARKHAATLFPDARFVELVDGAGYCGSLRRDLQHLIFAADTDDWFQLRSIPLRLRRILQASAVISPLEVAILVSQGQDTERSLSEALPSWQHAITGVCESLIEDSWLERSLDGKFRVASERLTTIGPYLLLDEIVARGRYLGETPQGDCLMVPGYGPNFGCTTKEVEEFAEWIEEAWSRGWVLRSK